MKEYLAQLNFRYREELEKIKELVRDMNDKENDKKKKTEAKNKLEQLITDIYKNDELWPHFLWFYLKVLNADKTTWLIDWWKRYAGKIDNKRRETNRSLWKQLIFTQPSPEIFPPGAWVINFIFTLDKPYISKDDNSFFLLDNPVKREAIFKLPYISPGQWKGALRSSLVHSLADWWYKKGHTASGELFINRRLQIVRLCGNEKEVELESQNAGENVKLHAYLDTVSGTQLATEYRNRLRSITPTGYLAGNLHFYPTVFNKTDLEVINPHDRVIGAGTLPIYLEKVPQGEQGQFTLLYVPFWHNHSSEAIPLVEALSDLELVVKELEKLLLYYGIGAKTSSGYGIVNEALKEGTLRFHRDDHIGAHHTQSIDIPEEYRKYLTEDNRVKPQFLKGEDLLSNNEYKNSAPNDGGSLHEFKRFRYWYKKVNINISPVDKVVTKEFKNFNGLKHCFEELRSEIND